MSPATGNPRKREIIHSERDFCLKGTCKRKYLCKESRQPWKVEEKIQGQCALDSETVGCILFSGKIRMPAMSSAKINQEKTLLEMCLEVMLNENVDLRKWCKKEQTEWATGEL